MKKTTLYLSDIKNLIAEHYDIPISDIVVDVGTDCYYGDPWCEFTFYEKENS